MTKHLIGFGLFVLIVTFFVLAVSFAVPPTIPEVTVFEVPPEFGTYCDRNRSVRIGTPRAIADRDTGEVTIYIDRVPGASDPSTAELNASFTFYFVGNGEPRLIDVVHDSLVNDTNRDNDTRWILRYKADWIKRLASDVNLYVVPDAAHVPSAFSKDSALPVVIKN